MLNTYLADLNNILQNPGATTSLYPTLTLTRFINIARGQVAGDGECIQFVGTIDTVIGQRNYNFSNITVDTAGGIRGVIHVRHINVVVGQGETWLEPHAWEWFNLYYLNTVTPGSGRPAHWAQHSQGSAGLSIGGGNVRTGDFWISPIPDAVYTLNCDCICYPIDLVNDSTAEALPYLWTDAVPFFAAYYAFLSSQTSARQADAERMFKHYETFLDRARKASNPSVLRSIYEQAGDPVQANKIALRSPAGAGG